jgi:Spy/CpxP family protein refolding chaperone
MTTTTTKSERFPAVLSHQKPSYAQASWVNDAHRHVPFTLIDEQFASISPLPSVTLNNGGRAMRAARLGLVLVSSLVLSSLGTIGCGSAGTEPQTQTQTGTTATDSNATIAPVAIGSHGMVKFVGDALSQVALRTEQRAAIEKLATDAETRHQSALPLRVNLANAIGAQVEAGKIDQTALQPQIDALSANWEAQRPLDHAAFQKMHDLLDATQRQAFVDAVHANMQARKNQSGGAHHGGHGEKMQEWATALNLTDAQKDQIKSSMQAEFVAHKGEMMQHMQEGKGGPGGEHGGRGHILDNFVADNFSVDQAMPQSDVKERVSEMTTHGIRFVELVMPTLTADQRKLAADKIRAKGANPEEEEGHAPL